VALARGGSPAGASQGAVEAQTNCNVGGAPTHPYGDQPPEDFLRYGTPPVRAVVTLPVGFRRRGTAAIDVSAEGGPLSERCGARAVLRRSAAKTLVVRVR
jgi:hypothetical protein